MFFKLIRFQCARLSISCYHILGNFCRRGTSPADGRKDNDACLLWR